MVKQNLFHSPTARGHTKIQNIIYGQNTCPSWAGVVMPMNRDYITHQYGRTKSDDISSLKILRTILQIPPTPFAKGGEGEFPTDLDLEPLFAITSFLLRLYEIFDST